MKLKHILFVLTAFGLVSVHCDTADTEDVDDEEMPEEDESSELYEMTTDDDDDEFDQPLVRCKRPICEMECPNGFQKDDSGCEICRCNDTSNSNLLGRPDGHEPSTVGCENAVMCMMYCENGFKTDSNGCQLCECQDAAASEKPLLGRPDGHDDVSTKCEDMAMCLMYCENGFKTDSNGCRMCECQEASSSDKPVLGRPDGHERSSNCSQIMCRMYCDLGFQRDSFGCPICACLENPCEDVVCSTGTECRAQPCDDIQSCKRLSAKCIPVQPAQPCAEPMCANYCPYGYKHNEQGCMTCECVPATVCGVSTCDEGQICRNVSFNPVVQKCSVKTNCEMQREHAIPLGQSAPECDSSGAFKPLQCNAKLATCWCVDGLGQEVNETRSTVYVDEHKPRCVQNKTTSMHIHMILVVKHDIDITGQLDSLNATIVDHVSSWLMIEPHYVKVTKAEPRTASDEGNSFDYDDNNDDSTDRDDYMADSLEDSSDDMPHQLFVELVVVHDGRTDLPSAADYMKRRIHKGQCEIPIDGGALVPNPKTVTTEHQFAQPPSARVDNTWEPDQKSWRCWKHWSGFRIALCAVAGTLFLLTVITVVAAIRRRRSHRMAHFRHHKLDSQVSVENPEKNFLNDEVEKHPIGHENDVERDEKLPIA